MLKVRFGSLFDDCASSNIDWMLLLLEGLDRFGYTPLHYAVMYNKVYPFIFLFCKMGLQFNQTVIQATLMQMCSNSDCSEIIQILLHSPEFKPWVMNVVFLCSLQKQNFNVVKLILRQAYRDLPEIVWLQALIFINSDTNIDVHKANFTKSLTKNRIK